MPDYKRIYGDILNSRYPDKKKYCENILHNDILTHLDVIKLTRSYLVKPQQKVGTLIKDTALIIRKPY